MHSFALVEMNDTVEFDAALHKYYVNGKAMSQSVTTVVHNYFSTFDGESIARSMLRGKSFWVDEEKYGKYWDNVKELSEKDAIQTIITMWDENRDEAAQLGTNMHESIENHLVNGSELPDTKECSMFLNFKALITSLGYVPYQFEKVVWDVSASIAGSVDAMFINPLTRDVWVVDWKRSKEIKMTAFRGKKGTGPMSNKQDCNYEHYSLQLNVYKYLLSNNFGEKIARMSLVILHPNQDDYILLDVADNQTAVESIMQERRRKYNIDSNATH